jgi:hypothetical protein
MPFASSESAIKLNPGDTTIKTNNKRINTTTKRTTVTDNQFKTIKSCTHSEIPYLTYNSMLTDNNNKGIAIPIKDNIAPDITEKGYMNIKRYPFMIRHLLTCSTIFFPL